MPCDGVLLPCSDGVLGNIILMVMYGAILALGSKVMADGSELLLDIFDQPAFIGGFLLPVLGAVPDTAIIIVSCLGPLQEAQSQINVGMGTLAGSTIMVLTVPWFGSLLAGRCDIENGESVDGKCSEFTKASWKSQGVSVEGSVPFCAVIMLLTGLSYVIVQGPAFAWATSIGPDDRLHGLESGFALAGFISCTLFFVGYSIYQVRSTTEQSKKADALKQDMLMQRVIARLSSNIQKAPKPEDAARNALSKWKKMASSKTGTSASTIFARGAAGSVNATTVAVKPAEPADDSDDEEVNTDPKWKIGLKSISMMVIGTAVVTVFSDPMVDSISAFSTYSGFPAFYVSFIVTPFASNASELISSLMFALKKKKSNSSITYAQLYGAATMNNTLGLGVFCAMVYFRGLSWSFSAEVIVILVAQSVVAVMAMRRTMPMWMIIPSILLYPLSLALVSFMESPVINWH